MQVSTEQLAAPYKISIIDDDVEKLEKRKDEIWEGLKSKVELRGFRKGNVPRSVVEKRSDLGELYRDLVNEVLQQGLASSGITVSFVQSATIVDWQAEQPLKIEAIVDVAPKVIDVEYKGLPLITSAAPEITVEQVEATVQRTRESLSTTQLLEDQRPAELNDLVVIDFKGTVRGKAFEGGSAENYQLRLGSGDTIAGFEDALVGMSTGESKEVDLPFPADYGKSNLAGKKAHFTLSLKEIHVVVLPDVDDEMAKDAGYNDLEEMRAALKKDLEQTSQDNYTRAIQAQLLQKLIEVATIEPIPQSLIQAQLDSILQEMLPVVGAKDPEEYFAKTKQKKADFEFTHSPRAIEDIRAKLVLEYIADKEGFVVTAEEREEYIRTNAAKINVSITQFQRMLSEESIDLNIRVQRANAYVADHAEITYE